MKINVCMGYWIEDRELAFEVIEQAGNLLGEKSSIVGLTYVYRFDSMPPAPEILERDSKYFASVKSVPTHFKYTGWPAGCNDVAYTVLGQILPKAPKDVECALILESDCVITRQGWDVELLEEWELTKKEKKSVCGCVLDWSYDRQKHVNASALWGRLTHKTLTGVENGEPAGDIAWDYYYGSTVMLLARHSDKFKLDWKRPTITSEELFADPALIFHGVKDRSALDAVNEKFKLNES